MLNFKHILISILTALVLFLPQIINAANPPNLIFPADNSAESKLPKLTWEYSGDCVQSGSCFLVEIDNNPDFSSPEKNPYTNNLSYSPQGLTEGSWNWRVKAKDSTRKWSVWSKIFKFSFSTQTASSPTPQSVQPAQTPQPSVTSQKIASVFTAKDIPPEIDSDQEFEVSIALKLPDKPGSTFYLKGAFKKGDSSNYFGQTSVGNSWIKNNSSYSNQFKIETDKDGIWEGKIKIRPDPDDSGFDGTGDYIFKVGKYTDAGSGPTWSNELGLRINSVEAPEPSPSFKVAKAEEETETSETDLTASLVKAAPIRNYEIKIASVAGEATKSDNIIPEQEHTWVLEEKKINWLLIILGVGILAGGAGFTIYKIRQQKIT